MILRRGPYRFAVDSHEIRQSFFYTETTNLTHGRRSNKAKGFLNLLRPLNLGGLNSHWFPVVGMVINPIVGVYIPIRRISNIRCLDPGTCVSFMGGKIPKNKLELDFLYHATSPRHDFVMGRICLDVSSA